MASSDLCGLSIKHITNYKDVIEIKKNVKYLTDNFYIEFLLKWSLDILGYRSVTNFVFKIIGIIDLSYTCDLTLC